MSLNNLGIVACEQGDYATARALHEESLAIRQELGDLQGIASSLDNLGDLAYKQGDYAAARALTEESLAIRRELGDQRGIAISLEGLASIAAARADECRAATIWGAAERLREEIGAPLPANAVPGFERGVARARAAYGDDSAFDAAWAEGRAMTLDEAVAYALEHGGG